MAFAFNPLTGKFDYYKTLSELGGQPLDSTLTALAAYNTDGLLVQTAPDTFTGRVITGTTNQITVTNGNGVSGNPTLSLPQNIHTNAVPTFGGLQLGSSVGQSTATPMTLDSGGTYADTITSTKAKWKLYTDGTPGNTYGIGITAGQMNFFKNTGGSYNWYFSDVEKLKLDSNGTITAAGNAQVVKLGVGQAASNAMVSTKLSGAVPGFELRDSANSLVFRLTSAGNPVHSYNSFDIDVNGITYAPTLVFNGAVKTWGDPTCYLSAAGFIYSNPNYPNIVFPGGYGTQFQYNFGSGVSIIPGFGATTNQVPFTIQASSGHTASIQEWVSSGGGVLSAIKADGSWSPPSIADASASNNSLYYSTTLSKLVYKDSGGTVNALY